MLMGKNETTTNLLPFAATSERPTESDFLSEAGKMDDVSTMMMTTLTPAVIQLPRKVMRRA